MTGNGSGSVLVISADSARAGQVAEVFRPSGMPISIEGRGSAAAAVLGPSGPSVMVLDMSLPELDLQLLREALGDGNTAPEPLEAVERRQIAAMLRSTGGNRRKAASCSGSPAPLFSPRS